MTLFTNIPAHLLPRGTRGGDLSSSLVAAAPSALPGVPSLLTRRNLPRLRSGAFSSRGVGGRLPSPSVCSVTLGREGRAMPGTHSHLPRCAADPWRPVAAVPCGPVAACFKREPSRPAACNTASGAPFVKASLFAAPPSFVVVRRRGIRDGGAA